MDYKQKYLKYKEKYIQLKNKLIIKNMKGGDLSEDIKQIPKNFPKQRTEIPPFYKQSNGNPVLRFSVSEENCSWDKTLDGYNPTNYTSDVVIYHDILKLHTQDNSYREFNIRTKQLEWVPRRGWADPENINEIISSEITEKRKVNWSTKQEIDWCQEYINGCLNERIPDLGNKAHLRLCISKLVSECVARGIKLRYTYTGEIMFDSNGYPLNPIGRTGLEGRGFLGNWGPNHAADPVVCRANPETKKLQFVLIKRLDNGQWGLPGGMVEAGQTIAGTRTREFAEEALNSTKSETETTEQYNTRVNELENKLKELFSEPTDDDILYQGVVDDPRNTDNSWMETVAILSVLTGENADLKLEAGDDAGKAKWTDYHPTKPLFASHKLFIDLAVAELVKRNLIVQNSETGEYFFK